MRRKSTVRWTAILLLFVLSAAASGCDKKEKDPTETSVLKISLTPEATPTEAPEFTDPKAVITNGSITMVNEYLNDGTYTPEEETPAEEETEP